MACPLVLVFTLLWMGHLCSAFPVHHLGRMKDVTPQNEKREHLLCWIVHIITHSECAAENGELDVDTGANVSHGKSGRPVDNSVTSRCASSRQSEQHANEVASELGLVVARVFKEFHDHYLMCHTEQEIDNDSTQEIFPRKFHISEIHQEHTAIRSQNADVFFQIKKSKESQLSSHHEILRFSQEFAFHRHSRRFSNPVSQESSPQSYHFHHQIQPRPYLKSNAKTFSSDKELGDQLTSTVYLSSIREINTLIHHTKCFSSNSSLSGSLSGWGICLPALCSLLKNLSAYVTTHLKTKELDGLLKENNESRFTVTTSMNLCSSLSSLPVKNRCLKIVSSLQELYHRCFSPLKENPVFKSSSSHLMKILSFLGIDNNNNDKKEDWRTWDSLIDLPAMRDSADEKVSNNSLHLREIHNIFRGRQNFKLFQRVRDRTRRSLGSNRPGLMFNDPAYPHQWHLHNHVTPSMDVNVTGVWLNNYTGQGVTVAVVDDGVEWRNPDLKNNYNYHGSWDLNNDDPDPSPNTKKRANHHGTRCAGEIASVANNNVCGVGVAYGSQISGLRVLDGVMTDSLEAEAFNMKMNINDIYSCSWGPDDDGKTVDGPHLMAAKAMKHGIDFGRKGYGSIFVVASGNGGREQDNCNFDGYANSIYTVTIGAVDENGRMPYYAEECASMLGVTFSSGMNNKRDIVTTDWTFHNPRGCTESHTGTSAAAPLAAGMIALMLSARPCLTWRDVQYILILTAKKIDVDIAHWQKNGAGLSHSHKHGFGLLDAWRMVNAARVWRPVPWMTSFSYTNDLSDGTIPKGSRNPLKLNHLVQVDDIHGYGLSVLESVQVTVWLTHPSRGKLGIKLISPSGTESVIAAPRPKDNSSAGFQGWTFTTVRNWGESPIGNWTLEVTDSDRNKFGEGVLSKWRLTLFGTPMTPSEFKERKRLVQNAMAGQFLSAEHTMPCAPPPDYQEEPSYLSEKTLKILVLASVFCIVMGVYESMEYLLCYGEEKKEHAREMDLARRALRMANRANAVVIGAAANPSLSNNTAATSDMEGSSVSLLTRDNSGALVSNMDDDDEDENDIFNASETLLRLNSPSSRNVSENFTQITNSPQSNGQTLMRFLSGASSEVIPMSTFSVSSTRNDGTATP